MSQYNQTQALVSSLQKKQDDTSNRIAQKIGYDAPAWRTVTIACYRPVG